MTDTPLKRCTKCGETKPATSSYFHRNKNALDGLAWQCKACAAVYNKQRHAQYPDKLRAQSLEYYYRHHEEQRKKQREWKQNNAEQVKDSKRRYRVENAEKVREYEKRYREENRPARLKRLRSWRERNHDYRSEYQKQYYASGRGKAATHRRLARKRDLPNTLTADDWSRCLAYWHGVCAYCGAQQSFWYVIEVDHYVPISSSECPGTVPENILPACKECNTSKHNRPAEQWLVDKFGTRRAAQIISRVEAYFEWVKARG